MSALYLAGTFKNGQSAFQNFLLDVDNASNIAERSLPS